MVEKLYKGDLPEQGEHEKGDPVMDGQKLYVANKKQEDEMASYFAELGKPLQEVDIPKPRPGFDPDEPVAQGSTVPADETLRVLGEEEKVQLLDLPEGEDLLLLMLHPERNEDGSAGEVPRIVLRSSCKEWDEWVRDVMKIGLTYGRCTSTEDVTVRGFRAKVELPDGKRTEMAFLFSQCAAIVPFRDIDVSTLRMERERDARRKQARVVAAKKKRKAKLAAKSRRINK